MPRSKNRRKSFVFLVKMDRAAVDAFWTNVVGAATESQPPSHRRSPAHVTHSPGDSGTSPTVPPPWLDKQRYDKIK